MAAKGSEAKSLVEKKIIEAFGSNYVGTYDKKVYVTAKENGEDVQIAITLTCPKVPVGKTIAIKDGGLDFSGGGSVVAPTGFQPAEITPEEEDNVRNLIKALGL